MRGPSAARERNFLSWTKLTVSLAVISAALLVRFQYGVGALPAWEQRAQEPVSAPLCLPRLHHSSSQGATRLHGFRTPPSLQLGIVFFIASLGSLASAAATFYRSQSGYARHKAFVYAGRATDVLMFGIAVLTLTTCIILLAADR